MDTLEQDLQDYSFESICMSRTSMFAFFVDELSFLTELAQTDPESAFFRVSYLIDLIKTSPRLTKHEQSVLTNIAKSVHIECADRCRILRWLKPVRDTQSQTKKPAAKPSSSVYFVLSEDKKMVKIGYSNNVTKRVRSMSTGSPVKLTCIKTIPGGASEEAELHRRFAHLRQHGEWFIYSKELKDFVKDL